MPCHAPVPPSAKSPQYLSIQNNTNRAAKKLVLHALEEVRLLDLGTALLAHGAAQLLPLVGGLYGRPHVARLARGEVDALLLQRDLGRQRLEIARCQDLLLLLALPLEREATLFLGFGCLSRGVVSHMND
jgi:hypothetical protein